MSFNKGFETKRTIHVFLSYNAADLALARRLRLKLEGSGATVFLAQDSVRPGHPLTPGIRAALSKAAVVVALWSENASKSGWVRHEIGLADGKGKLMILFAIGAEKEIPPPTADIKYTLAADDFDRGSQQLADEIERIFEDRRQAVDDRNAKAWLLLISAATAIVVSSGRKR